MDEWITHNSHDLQYRKPFGAVSVGESISVSLKVNSNDKPEAVILNFWQDLSNDKQSIQMKRTDPENNFIYNTTIKAPSEPGLLWYNFTVIIHGTEYYYGNNSGYGGQGKIVQNDTRPYQITVYSNKNLPPNWFKEKIMYQIFVDRFYNGNEDGRVLNTKKRSLLHADWDNDPIYIKDDEGKIVYWDFFGGNLLGVKKKLPYLKELGVGVIYFNPIFESPSNHKYDTGDYHKIDPMFGDNKLFEEFCKEAEGIGISIILDGVFSHTGSDSIYFNREGNYPTIGAYQSKESPYYPWYKFSDHPDSYESWWGVEVLPNVNELEPTYQNFIISNENSVLKHWQGLGIKGWRLDVADELPDSFIKEFKNKMRDTDNDSILIGEVWEDASNKISYSSRRKYLIDEELDSVTNYPFRNALIDYILGYKDAKAIHMLLMSLYENYPVHHFYSMMNLIGSHDTPRILSVLQNEVPEQVSDKEKKDLSIRRLKLISLMQMTFPGVPLIYYGDESGLDGAKEPLNRKTYPWGKENHILLTWYKEITALRNKYDVFKTGNWISFYYGSDIYGYARVIDNETDVFDQRKKNNTAIVLFNRSSDSEINLSLNISKWFSGTVLFEFLSKQKFSINNGELHIKIKPIEGKVLIENELYN